MKKGDEDWKGEKKGTGRTPRGGGDEFIRYFGEFEMFF